MYLTLYIAEDTDTVFDAIKEVDTAQPLFTQHCHVIGDDRRKLAVQCGAVDNVPAGIATCVLAMLTNVEPFIPNAEYRESTGVSVLVLSDDPVPLHRDNEEPILGLWSYDMDEGSLSISMIDDETSAHLCRLTFDHLIKGITNYVDDPRPMSEKIGEEIEKELENLK